MEDPKLQFNLHPVLMVGGYITLSGFCKLHNYTARIFFGLMFHLFNCSHFIVSYLPLLFTLNCQAVSYIFPCMLHSMYRHRFPSRLGFSQSDSNAQLLLVALLAWLHHHGTFRSTVCSGILQVCIEHMLIEHVDLTKPIFYILVFSSFYAAKMRHISSDRLWFQSMPVSVWPHSCWLLPRPSLV